MNKMCKICGIVLIISIILLIPLVTYARYFEKIENIKGKAIIAEPIFRVENLQDKIVEVVNKESKIKEYIFEVRNYEVEPDGIEKRISQVDMEYNIEIKHEKNNFPIKCELYEVEKNENLLQQNNKTENFKTEKNKEYVKKYKLCVRWERKSEALENSDNVKIIINSNQVK